MNNSLALINNIDVNAVQQTMAKVAQVQAVIQNTLQEGKDYGKIPGAGDKPSLFKPGAEKVLTVFGISPQYEFETKIEDYTGKGFFMYTIRCNLYRQTPDGELRVIGQGVGSANSRESKYYGKWYTEKKLPEGVDKNTCKSRERDGNYGKYTEYYVEADDGLSLANTILKMAKKRAMVDATLTVASLSDLFTQDIEDMSFDSEDRHDARQTGNAPTNRSKADEKYFCDGCGAEIQKNVHTFSKQRLGRPLCRDCQALAKEGKPTPNDEKAVAGGSGTEGA
jgi:hypothetical protein